jgi:hypothetical protein
LKHAELLRRRADIEHVLAFGHHQFEVEDIAAGDPAAHTSMADAGWSKAYSPACKARPRLARRASQKSQRLPITPALANSAAMPPVDVPRGSST